MNHGHSQHPQCSLVRVEKYMYVYKLIQVTDRHVNKTKGTLSNALRNIAKLQDFPVALHVGDELKAKQQS